jgi:hypothetical protein
VAKIKSGVNVAQVPPPLELQTGSLDRVGLGSAGRRMRGAFVLVTTRGVVATLWSKLGGLGEGRLSGIPEVSGTSVHVLRGLSTVGEPCETACAFLGPRTARIAFSGLRTPHLLRALGQWKNGEARQESRLLDPVLTVHLKLISPPPPSAHLRQLLFLNSTSSPPRQLNLQQ